MIFLYDGTFEGFLSAVFDAFAIKEDVSIEKKDCWQPQLFADPVEVESVPEKAEKVAEKLLSICGSRGFSAIVQIFLSEAEGCETAVFYLIKSVIKYGTKAFSRFQDEKIAHAMAIRKKVSKECERFLGILRFTELSNGVFYAACEPDHNIIPLIAGHFYERLSGTRWMIHDLRRGFAVYHSDGNMENVEFTDELTSHLNMTALLGKSENEDDFAKMWRGYFKTIAIESRTNPKLQRQFMPQRYWKYLTEKKSS